MYCETDTATCLFLVRWFPDGRFSQLASLLCWDAGNLQSKYFLYDHGDQQDSASNIALHPQKETVSITAAVSWAVNCVRSSMHAGLSIRVDPLPPGLMDQVVTDKHWYGLPDCLPVCLTASLPDSDGLIDCLGCAHNVTYCFYLALWSFDVVVPLWYMS